MHEPTAAAGSLIGNDYARTREAATVCRPASLPVNDYARTREAPKKGLAETSWVPANEAEVSGLLSRHAPLASNFLPMSVLCVGG